MLNNPQWDKLSLESAIAWLEKQPATEIYDWRDGETCLLARYLNDMGMDHNQDYRTMPWYSRVAQQRPWTFGAALERAKSLI